MRRHKCSHTLTLCVEAKTACDGFADALKFITKPYESTRGLTTVISKRIWLVSQINLLCYYYLSGLRGLEVAFPPHGPREAGSNPAEVVEFLRTEKFGNEVLRKGL
jgi:hypothetical protein